MRHLRKTLWAIGLIVVMQLLKIVFDRTSPQLSIFYHNLFTCIQVAILLWLIISISLELVTRKDSPGKLAVKTGLILLSIFAIPEMLITYWLYHPAKIPSFLTSTFRDYYNGIQRNVIQLNPDCSVYDSNLLYTLKPSSSFVFKNYEFADTFNTNRMGLRDDDSSLSKPGIICLGDSHAMGWGVRQEEAFPQLLEKMTGERVLNAAISSYGTARELKNLYRLDTSALHYIIIQYCNNDETENADFVKNNFSLQLSSKEIYTAISNLHYWNKLWFPGKHFITMTKMFVSGKVKSVSDRKENIENSENSHPGISLHESAFNFIEMLLHSPINFKKVKVLVTEINERESMNNNFLNEIASLATAPVYKEHFNNHLITMPMADILGKDDYYILDSHLRSSGHQKIAARISDYIKQNK